MKGGIIGWCTPLSGLQILLDIYLQCFLIVLCENCKIGSPGAWKLFLFRACIPQTMGLQISCTLPSVPYFSLGTTTLRAKLGSFSHRLAPLLRLRTTQLPPVMARSIVGACSLGTGLRTDLDWILTSVLNSISHQTSPPYFQYLIRGIA